MHFSEKIIHLTTAKTLFLDVSLILPVKQGARQFFCVSWPAQNKLVPNCMTSQTSTTGHNYMLIRFIFEYAGSTKPSLFFSPACAVVKQTHAYVLVFHTKVPVRKLALFFQRNKIMASTVPNQQSYDHRFGSSTLNKLSNAAAKLSQRSGKCLSLFSKHGIELKKDFTNRSSALLQRWSHRKLETSALASVTIVFI